jgi:hypothetical protein
MTNWLAFLLSLFILGFIALDHFVLHWGIPIFLAKRANDLIVLVAFWR